MTTPNLPSTTQLPTDPLPSGMPPGGEARNITAPEEETPVAVASQWKLTWWRFRRHRVAVASAVIVLLFYVVTLVPGFFATSSPRSSKASNGLIPPQTIRLFEGGRYSPHVYAVEGRRDPQNFQKVWVLDPSTRIPVEFFGAGFEYRVFGLFTSNRHLIAVGEGYDASDTLFLLGTDEQGRDMWSRIVYATQISLSIGLLGVILSLFLGILLGGVSGYFGGWIDQIIQRFIEIIRSIPTIPLWMGLAAAVPRDWSILQVYFAITIIISLFGWTGLARVVRGRFLSLREEDFVAAAEVIGASRTRIIFRHMLPSFYSHIIAATTLAIPTMIISETSLSFLGLGLRPPAISWGVLLQLAQNVQTIALTPWLIAPALPVIIVILAFNFLGDGLRDAADPYR